MSEHDVREAIHAWIRDDVPLGMKMMIRPEHVAALTERLEGARASDTGRSEAEDDDSFSRELQAAYARNDADGYARVLSGRLRQMDKRAKAANRRADHLEVKLRLMRVRAEGAEADRGAGRSALNPPARTGGARNTPSARTGTGARGS